MDDPKRPPPDALDDASYEALHLGLTEVLHDATRDLPCGYVLITRAVCPDGTYQMMTCNVEPETVRAMLAAAAGQADAEAPAVASGRPS